jgi:hypothetical protein
MKGGEAMSDFEWSNIMIEYMMNGFVSDEIISCTCRNVLNSLTHKFPLCEF